MRQTLLRLLRLAALWLFWPGVAVIAWGELTPHPPQLAEHIWDKAEHFTAYFGLASMATLVIGLKRQLALALCGVVALGAALEVLQYFTGRDAELGDVIANTLGALCGLAIAAFFIRVLGTRPLVGGRAPD